MADIVQKIIPIRVELDSAEEYRTAFNTQFCLNLRADLNLNAKSNTGNVLIQGSNVRKQTPIQSPELLCPDITLPSGNNIATGAFESKNTQEIYWFVWNDLGNHSIWVYGIETQTCRKVYEGSCLNFHFEPQYHIPAHRAALFIVYDSDTDGNRTIRNKYLTFTDGINWQFLIDVESSIATDSYNASTYPYFTTFYPHCDPCEAIQLGIRPPQDCPVVLPFDDDTQLQFYEAEPENNNLKQKVWYFSYSYIDIWGRHSVMSPYSTAVFIDGGDCNANADDIKCFRLQLNAGSWMVEKIVVYFSNDGINWFKYDEIDKWEDCTSPSPENFWDRELALKNCYVPNTSSPPCSDTGCFSTTTYSWDLAQSPQLEINSASIVINHETKSNDSISGFHGLILWLNSLGLGTFAASVTDQISTSSASNVYGTLSINSSPSEQFEPDIAEVDQCGTANTFIYQFCGNKQCIPVSPAEVARLFDDLPIASVAQAVVDENIAYGNNLRNYDNFLCPIENIQITLEQDDQPCEPELVTITIQAVIFNAYDHTNNPIYKMEDSEQIAFGGFGDLDTGGIHYENEVISAYKQQVVSGIGIPAGFRGTNFKQYSQQFQIGTTKAIDMPAPSGDIGRRNLMQEAYGGKFYYQQWKFLVPKGNYIFEIYSHLSTIDNCEGTSTYFFGHCRKEDYNPNGALPGTTNTTDREIHINACSGDVDYSEYIIIADLTKPKASISASPDAKAFAGYLTEVDTNLPVELADVDASKSLELSSGLTDHNGFFYGTASGSDYTVDLRVFDQSCVFQRATLHNLSISEKQLNVFNSVVNNEAALPNFNECAHEVISGRITDCDGNPIGGVPVVLTRTGRYGVTDANGDYSIIAHDNAYIFDASGLTRKTENVDSLYVMLSGACILSSCDDCETCIPTQHVNWTNSCFKCSTLSPPTVATDTYNFVFDLISGALTGVKTGGTFAVSIIGYDYLDRNNSAQLIGTFTAPTIQSNGIFAPYHFHWSFLAPLNLPSWVKKLRFAIRGNSNLFLLSWVASKIEFVDSAGNITAPGIAVNIKVYIDGINEFRDQNFLNTNVQYQFLEGDRIRFVTNGDQQVFDAATNNGLIDLPVSKLIDGNVLLIPFDPRLIDLTANARFDLYRTPVCEVEPVYWEQCPSIPVIDGEPIVTSGVIPFFDTYWFFRAIPQTNQDGLPTIFVSPHRYEHFAPSDFWGAVFTADIPSIRLLAFGRSFIRNENARQTWHIDEIGRSDSLLEDGIINGLGTWRTENIKNYGVGFFGGIVGMKAWNHFLYAQCENDFFGVNISLNLLQVTAQGNVVANPDFFGASGQKIGNNFGVDYRDTSTLIFYDDWLTFVDVRRAAACVGNYQSVQDISKLEAKSYFIEKMRKVASLRDQDQFTDGFMFIHQGVDPKTGEIILTSFARINGEVKYGTPEIDINIGLNETVSFNYPAQFWSGNYSFTPERYICYESGLYGSQLISFVQGKAWVHHKINPSIFSYNNFYGEQYRKAVKFVMNGGEQVNLIQKIYLATRVECSDEKFTCDNATTQTGQLSKIPSEAFEKIQNYFEAPILMDENSAVFSGLSALIDGTNLFGSWIKMRFVGEEGKENEYCEIKGFIIASIDGY